MLGALVKKELLALSRDLHGLAALFLMPVIFIVIMSLALKDVYNPPLRELAYAVKVHDEGELAQALLAVWQERHGEPRALPVDWVGPLRSGQLKYVLVVEPGLSEELGRAALPRRSVLHLVTEPGMDSNLFNALRAELTAIAGEIKFRAVVSAVDADAPDTASMQALVDAQRHASTGPRPTAVQQNVPAWLVFGMFFVVTSVAGLFIQERSSGTLARLHSLGVGRIMLLASKAVPYLGINAVQAALMLAVGVWLMPVLGGDALSLAGVDWAALTLAVAAVSAAAVGLALALSCLVRTHAQASAVGPILNVLMGAVGGIMVPKFVMPGFMQQLAGLSPMNWGLEALLTVLLRGGDVSATLPHAARLGAFAGAMLVLALFLFRRTLR
ncbi:ABC transporter permease [Schlegelella sp. S2-27]|uniref:ABC transporter permease n=1 Tax=Caldimonas mangrovi TaxID=2944811 RepID=A0ABT0YLD6_9BURK|nr:ABC transporter permease [Caldimonas mangrovi]MCM5679174.1 ABC transporter permease [Caldimonas mangrovi]